MEPSPTGQCWPRVQQADVWAPPPLAICIDPTVRRLNVELGNAHAQDSFNASRKCCVRPKFAITLQAADRSLVWRGTSVDEDRTTLRRRQVRSRRIVSNKESSAITGAHPASAEMSMQQEYWSWCQRMARPRGCIAQHVHRKYAFPGDVRGIRV